MAHVLSSSACMLCSGLACPWLILDTGCIILLLRFLLHWHPTGTCLSIATLVWHCLVLSALPLLFARTSMPASGVFWLSCSLSDMPRPCSLLCLLWTERRVSSIVLCSKCAIDACPSCVARLSYVFHWLIHEIGCICLRLCLLLLWSPGPAGSLGRSLLIPNHATAILWCLHISAALTSIDSNLLKTSRSTFQRPPPSRETIFIVSLCLAC